MLAEPLGNAAKSDSVDFFGAAEEAEEDVGGEEGVAAGGVAVVGGDGEVVAEGVEGEGLEFVVAEGAVAFQVKSQVHGV